MKKNYDVVVVGGGASGMMAAIAAARQGRSVILLEKNYRLGEKLRITGGGRCNIWNEEHDERLLLANYGDAEKFLYSSFARFGLDETIGFFRSLGLKTKVEAKNRAFPVSESANDVVEGLETEINRLNMTVKLNVTVTGIKMKNGLIDKLSTSTGEIAAEKYIIATGGVSHPETGSTGDGFTWLKRLGHKVSAPTQAITPLQVNDTWIRDLSGVTLTNIRIVFYNGGKRFLRLDGDVLCTHFGLSGPLVLNHAAGIGTMLRDGKVSGSINLYPHLNEKEFDRKILDAFEAQGARQAKNVLRGIFPAGTSKSILKLCPFMNLEQNAADVTREQRLQLVRLLQNLEFTVADLMGFEKAVVADGGLDISEIDMKTMQSKLIKNLHITGDLLNIRRPSGGYSLQLCWTTGYLAGIS